MPIYIPEHMTLPTQVHVSKNGSAMSSGHLSIQQEGEQEWHWADVWASTQHLPTIPWQGHPLETNTILLPYPQVLSSRTRSPTHKAIFRMEPEEKKVHPPASALFHILPHIQYWHLLQCIPSLCFSHTSDQHTGGQICPKMH